MPYKNHKNNSLDALLRVRVIAGYLGQTGLAGWWDCTFLTPTGIRFLETTFPRSAKSAAVRSVSEAACLIHDEALGKVGLFHLFRFPPILEARLEEAIESGAIASMIGDVSSRETAMEALRSIADSLIKAPEGPVQIGLMSKIETRTSVQELAAHYFSAFENDIRCFPYFAPDKPDA